MIVYRDSVDGIQPHQLKGFFVGWPSPPSVETHLDLLDKSSEVCLAVDDEIGAVVGFITAVSDGVLSAYIPLLEVLPAYQGKGIGKQLVARMLDRLEELYMVDLQCDAELQPFYKSFGMRPATGMSLRRPEKLGLA